MPASVSMVCMVVSVYINIDGGIIRQGRTDPVGQLHSRPQITNLFALPSNPAATYHPCLRTYLLPSMSNHGHLSQILRNHRKEDSQHDSHLSPLPLSHLAVTLLSHSPLASLKENVVLAAIVNRYGAGRREETPAVAVPIQCQAQFHILIDIANTNTTLLPHCFSQVVFATAFIDEILEQQSQSNFVVLRCPGKSEDIAIAGRLLRPETYHYSMNASQF